MSDNEKLIEEALWALEDYRATGSSDAYFRAQDAIKALAVFEKAHTPTDEHAPVTRRINFRPSTITLDLETGDWIEPKPAITGAQAARVAASVLPGVSEEQIARWYDQFMSGAGPQGEPSDAQVHALTVLEEVEPLAEVFGNSTAFGRAVIALRRLVDELAAGEVK